MIKLKELLTEKKKLNEVGAAPQHKKFIRETSMKKAYHLGNCNTCQRILQELKWDGAIQEIRSEKITEAQLDEMARLAGSYEALFSRRAIKYKSMGLKAKG